MIFLDTTIFVAASDKSDRYHGDSKQVLLSILKGKLPTALTTDYVLNETFTLLAKRTALKKAAEVLRAIHGSKRIITVFVDENLFLDAISRAEKLPEGFSFTDITSFAVMQKYKIKEIYSHDSDFDKIAGVERKTISG